MRNSKYFECTKHNWENRGNMFKSDFWNVVEFSVFLQRHLSHKRHFSVFCPKAMAGSSNQMLSWLSWIECLTQLLSATVLASFQPLVLPVPVASVSWCGMVMNSPQLSSVTDLYSSLLQHGAKSLPGKGSRVVHTCLSGRAVRGLPRSPGTRPAPLRPPSSSFAACPFPTVGNAGVLRKPLGAPTARYILGPFRHSN